MTTFPGSPRMLKGALVGIDPLNPLAGVVIFQYNPQTLTRSLKPRGMAGEGAIPEAMRLTGPPEETIKVEVEIDATDQMEKGEGTAVGMGIYPQLSALEMFVYPKSSAVIANTALAAMGTIEIIPTEGPFILFIWGTRRILPVRLTEFEITEEAFDVSLNPIRARVSLGLRVLSYNDLPVTHPGYHLFFTHQVAKEAMAVVGSIGNFAGAVGGNVRPF